ncbi:hypothetical protein [Nonomuraea sp. GTA35]|uniref:hypothetical protein n=1 Tax=Nonomuraea sp. GTA35 TaxID=1676746 RepID=UPI0035C0F7B8
MSEVLDLIAALRRGELGLEDVARRFRERHWEEPGAFPVDDLMAKQLHDPPPDVPGSVDDLNLAYARGHLSAEEYDYLADAAIDSMRAQEDGSG